MLSVNRLSKLYADVVVLRDVSFVVNAGERVGLVGPNGSGKTTLFRIILSQDSSDSGSAQAAAGVRVGYLAQGFAAPPEATLASCLTAATGDLTRAEAEVERRAAALARSSTPETVKDYEAALDNMQTLLARADPGQAQAALAHLGLDDVPPATRVASLSGGQKTRLALALVLVGNPQLLLLDEPTNHLDLEMLNWLEGWLRDFRGAAVIVSHDRTFLDHTVTRILELDSQTHRLREFTGNYSAYVKQTLAERERQRSLFRDQQAEIRRMRADIARTKEQSQQVERATTPRQPGVRRIAKKVARKAVAREKKLERYVRSDERVEKPRAGWQMKLEFDEAQAGSREVAVLHDAAIGYSVPLLQGVNLSLRLGERVVLIGPNGAGKTTLARTLAGEIPALRGEVRLGASVRLGYFAQEQELLRAELNALTTLQQASHQTETDLRSFLHYFLFEDDEVFTPVAQLSYGERARLALAVLVARGATFLLLDEPINHLDIPSRARFEQALAQFEGASLVITHDRFFIEQFATKVWKVEAGGVREYLDVEQALYRERAGVTADFADYAD